MKKSTAIILMIVMIISSVLGFAGCSKNNTEGYDMVLITNGAPINDGAYNESAWKGVKEYGEENNISFRYYQPVLDDKGELSVETIKNYIDLAAKDGAKFVILPGEAFAVGINEIAPAYSEINFILIDAYPHPENDNTTKFISNVMCISFNALEAGYLAGYCSVLDGFTKLGYVGSVNSKNSGDYGAGYVQGAAAAADSSKTPVIVEYANYDAENLNYDYSFTVEATYKKVSDEKEKTFKVKVVDGMGSGVYTDGENVTITANPAPEGKVFDHWETKSNTEGVRDKKVNISSKNDASMNLLVGSCDCTITAVWKDAETKTITVQCPDPTDPENGSGGAVLSYYAPIDSEYNIEAPEAPEGYVFDKWISSQENAIENPEEKNINVKVEKNNIKLTPVYKKSENPTFYVDVVNGSGSGAYISGDKVKLVADEPKDGYMFDKWVSVDNQGLKTGIAMENEYCYHTEFEMVDRYASVAEKMFDGGTQIVFGGGNPLSDSIFEATESFDYQVWAFGSGIDEGSKKNCFASVVNDYGAAVKIALSEYKPGGVLNACCKNNCIYVTGKSLDEKTKDKKGNNIDNPEYNAEYAMRYKALSEGKINLVNMVSGGDVRLAYKSSCLTLYFWIQ